MPVSQTVTELYTPEAVEGWNLVETDTALAFPALIKFFAPRHEKILWIDSSNQANTHHFESRPELLEKIFIARAFTALQHFQLCKNIGEYDLIVAPEIDRLYRESSLYRSEAVELFENMLESIEGKILYSTTSDLGLKAEQKADSRIEVEQTSQGLKFSQGSRQTQFYSDTTGVQTTVPYHGEVRSQWEEPIKPIETGWKN
jgi:hypothetical protein